MKNVNQKALNLAAKALQPFASQNKAMQPSQYSVQKESKESSMESTMQSDRHSDLSSSMRWIARFVLVLVSFVWYSPHVHAAVDRMTQAPALNLIENHYPLGAELEQLRGDLAKLQRSLVLAQKNQASAVEHQAALEAQHESIQARIEPLRDLDEAQQQALEDQLAHFQAKQVANTVLERHERVLNDYSSSMEALYTHLDDLKNTSAPAEQLNTVRQALDLLSTPFSKPHESLSNNLDLIVAPPRSIHSQQSEIDSLVGNDAGNYLATDSATRTSAAIQNRVADLGTNPLALYEWVYNTIRWVPSYGVMQGADYTLQSEQGNAFDTSSLLIALLREAGHEARYRYGIVNVPVDQMTNWTGNVKNADAAINLMIQGSIPLQGISYGGAIEEIQFEHVWVEVKEGNTWYALDPSFKQYTYTEGMNLEAAVNFDAQGLLTQLENTSTSNETEGWVQGVDMNLIQTELTNYQNELDIYLTQNAPTATLDDVLGQQQIQASTAATLSDAEPAYAVSLSQKVDQLPDTMFHRFRLQVGDTFSFNLGQSFEWNQELFELNELTTNLVGRDIAISFRPATVADQQAIESFFPETVNSAEDLPSSIPASSIEMVGELTLDGQVQHSTPPVTLGAALKTRLGYQPPERSFRFTENNLVAGQYQAVGIDMQGISPEQLQTLESKLDSTQSQLQANNISGLTKHDVVGNVMQAGVQGYMAMTYAADRIAAETGGVAYDRQPSYGTFSTDMQVAYMLTGEPSQVTFTGVAMDIDRLNGSAEDRANCYEDWVAFNRASGMRNSAFEHQIPEQLFSTPENQLEGVSTAKALAIAMSQGQRIYTLTQQNANELNNITIDAGSRSEIQSALNQGLEVTVHQTPVNVNGWQGSGYAIIDPEYGIGAYQISGGNSGAILIILGVAFLMTFLVSAFYLGPHMWAFLLTPNGQLIVGGVLSSAVSMISRGIEIVLGGSASACNVANGAIAGGIGALLGLWLPIAPLIPIIIGLVFSGVLPCI